MTTGPDQPRIRRNEWHLLEVPEPDDLVPELTVSVVIPAHGSSTNLRRCLVSLAAQTYPSELLEVMVVDDASDPPLDVPDRIGGLEIGVRRHEPHGTFGAGRARVTGAEATSGQVIVFLDADIVAPPTFVAAHARWHHVVDHAVVTSRIGFAPFDDIEPDALAALLATGDLDAMASAREGEGQAWRDKQFARSRDLTVDAADLFRTTVGAITSLHRRLYDAAGGYRVVGIRGVEDTEFGYRLHTHGGLFVLDRTHRLWHQGLRSFDAGRRDEILEARAPYVEALIPVAGFRDGVPSRTDRIPRASIHLSDGSSISDRAAGDLVSAERAGRLSPLDAGAIPASVHLGPGVTAPSSAIEAMLEALWSPAVHAAVHAIATDGRILVSARSQRAAARARHLGAATPDEIDRLAAELFGERWIVASELGISATPIRRVDEPSEAVSIVEEHASDAPTRCDLVYVTDLRFPGGTTSSLVQEVRAAVEAGYRVGLLHLSNPALGQGSLPSPPVARLLGDDRVIHLLPGEHATAPLVIVKHPMVFHDPVGGRLSIDTDQVLLAVGQVPGHLDGTVYYDPLQVDSHVTEAFGVRPRWAPVSPAVRSSLRAAASEGLALTDEDWVEVIDPSQWPTRSDRPIDLDAIVIGRHGRPDRLKWPGDPSTVRGAYPDDPRVRVRVLGAPDDLATIADGVPDNWEVLSFGSVPPAEFLADLDVFVYHHHPDLVEAFGRTILEALTVGVAVVVGPHFEPLFGDACVYADPSDTLQVVERLAADPEVYRRQVEAGWRVVRERFSLDAHLERVQRLVGSPSRHGGRRAPGRHDLITPRQLADRPVVLVSALGMSGREIDQLTLHLDAQRRRGLGFVPVLVVVAGSAPPCAEQLGIEVRSVTSPGRHDASVEPWEHMAARRLRRLAVHYGASAIVPGDPTRPEAALAMSTWPSGGDGAEGGLAADRLGPGRIRSQAESERSDEPEVDADAAAGREHDA